MGTDILTIRSVVHYSKVYKQREKCSVCNAVCSTVPECSGLSNRVPPRSSTLSSYIIYFLQSKTYSCNKTWKRLSLWYGIGYTRVYVGIYHLLTFVCAHLFLLKTRVYRTADIVYTIYITYYVAIMRLFISFAKIEHSREILLQMDYSSRPRPTQLW